MRPRVGLSVAPDSVQASANPVATKRNVDSAARQHHTGAPYQNLRKKNFRVAEIASSSQQVGRGRLSE
jgi:hypothetical protein